MMQKRDFSFQNPVEEANMQQRIASNPCYSVFVSASAGSGKTKLLVDRLLRLMMPRLDEKGKIRPGIHPRKIQCLTYSNAAAAEMSIRLQRKLGEWVGFTDQELARSLSDLEIPVTSDTLKSARALFAQVLDLPDGMRIETNHAFCQSILRRFPLEADIMPRFSVIEEGDNLLTFKRAFNEKIDEISMEDIHILSPLVNNVNFLELLQELQKNQLYLQPVLIKMEQNRFEAYLRGFLELSYGSKDEYLKGVCQDWFGEQNLRHCVERLKTVSAITVSRVAEATFNWLNLSLEQRMSGWDSWQDCFFTKDGALRKLKLNKKDNQEFIKDLVFLNEQADHIQKVSETLNKYEIYKVTLALLNVFLLIWRHYQTLKRMQGVLYYSDLINCTLQLLDDPGAAWVLYKLDGGLDHILLDEVQDNSAEQWKIAVNLSAEFFAGSGRETSHNRTVFAVGDYKQSIYSFQGAQPEEFFHWKKMLGKRVQDAGESWADPQLRVSFRSSQIILDFVDQVFSVDMGLLGVWDGIAQDQDRLHRSAYMEAPGRIDVWPLVTMDEVEQETMETLWKPLKINQQHVSEELALADFLADWIKKQIGQIPPYGGKPIQAGDILILIRKRSSFSRAFIRSLKIKGIPLANLIKTQLLDQIAVQDLLVLCEVLLLPQDDLSLACVLKSPLCGLSEESLMELAISREKGQTLWAALFTRYMEKEVWHTAWSMLSRLFSRVDYITPYALLVEILGEHCGRAKLLARLGGEVLEAIDELLALALQYENSHIPSLQGFLYWIKQTKREIQNKAETSLDMVRIMTIHGAKGLQGRLVIIPDTMQPFTNKGGFQVENNLIWQEDPEGNKVPLYIPNKHFEVSEKRQYQMKRLQQQEAESNRLLYVALTRASEWLLVCGWGKAEMKKTWYTCCLDAMKKQENVKTCIFDGTWNGEHYFVENCTSIGYGMENIGQYPGLQEKTGIPEWLGAKQGWIGRPLPVETPSASQYIPSRPEGVVFGEIPETLSPIKVHKKKDPLYRGRLVHALLQYLPDCPATKRHELAIQWLQKEASGLSLQERENIVYQVMQVIEHSGLKALFKENSLVEQPITGIVNGVVVTGQIDRMCVLPDQVIVCDFKSGGRVPVKPETVPQLYLRQMAAYWVLLRDIYPDRKIRSLLIWTDALKIMELPDDLLEINLPVKK